MDIRFWLGTCMTVASIAWSLPIPAKAAYYLQNAAGLAALVVAVIYVSDEYRKDPQATMKALVRVVIPLIVVVGGLALLIREFSE